ncbi:GTP cyclohydrolase [Leifsonia xyli]|jgi:GTP cyclohydrolase I|uniref:GTP cyclohydrolase I n=1 Tax=Leifsonia xyli TaxID=1575 RepID=UPI0007CDFE0F|nr:GTP cyclohydrolase [Leifsonia xyli]
MSLATDTEEEDAALEPVPGPWAGAIDRHRAEAAIVELLSALGRDTAGPQVADTPRRVAAAYAEMLDATPLRMTTFPNDEGYDDLVLVRDIPFTSLCAHHLLPFRGVAHVGYLPAGRLLGLSKLARVVEHFSRDLQLQERLTMQVADFLDEQLEPRGVGVVLEAEHLCMSARGVRAAGTLTRTSRFTGELAGPGRELFTERTAGR